MIKIIKKILENKNVLAATIIFIIILIWMLSGILFNENDKYKSFKKLASVKIKVENITIQKFNPTISISAKIESEQSMLIKSQVAGNITNIKIKSGEMVKSGQLLLIIDGNAILAKLKKAHINHNESLIEYKANKKLYNKKLISESGFEKVKLKVANAKADLESIKNEYNKHYIKSPFSGQIGIVRVKKDETINQNQEMIDVENKSKYKVVAFVSIRQKAKIKKGNKFYFYINNKKHFGTITAMSSTPERIVKTYRIEGKIKKDEFVAGQPVKITINLDQVNAHFIPSSLFNINDDGDLSIKILNKNNKVILKKVDIVEETSNGSWIVGLDKTTKILTDGAGFAKIGSFIVEK